MKTETEKTNREKNSTGIRNRERLKRLLKEMLAGGTALELCAQQVMRPTFRRIVE